MTRAKIDLQIDLAPDIVGLVTAIDVNQNFKRANRPFSANLQAW